MGQGRGRKGSRGKTTSSRRTWKSSRSRSGSRAASRPMAEASWWFTNLPSRLPGGSAGLTGGPFLILGGFGPARILRSSRSRPAKRWIDLAMRGHALLRERVGREGSIEQLAEEPAEVVAAVERGEVGIAAGLRRVVPTGGDGRAQRIHGLGGQLVRLSRAPSDRHAEGQFAGGIVELGGILGPQSPANPDHLGSLLHLALKPQGFRQAEVMLAQRAAKVDRLRRSIEGHALVLDGLAEDAFRLPVFPQLIQNISEIIQ